MESVSMTMWLGIMAGKTVALGITFFIRSTIIISAGLAAVYLLRSGSVTLRSAVLKTTLVMVVLSVCGDLIPYESPSAPIRIILREPRIEGNAIIQSAVNVLKEYARITAAGETSYKSGSIAPGTVRSAHTDAESTSASAGTAPVAVTPDDLLLLFYMAVCCVWIVLSLYYLLEINSYQVIIRRIRQTAHLAGSAILNEIESAAAGLGIRPPAVMITRRVSSPLLTGIVRPTLFLPIGGGNTVPVSREILVHELAHLKRLDILWNLTVRMCIMIFPFQPLLRLLARAIEETGEYVCDDFVLTSGANPRDYVSSLASMAEYADVKPVHTMVCRYGVMMYASSLDRRIKRIVDNPHNQQPGKGLRAMPLAVFTGLIIAGTSVIAGFDADSHDSYKTSALIKKIVIRQPRNTAPTPLKHISRRNRKQWMAPPALEWSFSEEAADNDDLPETGTDSAPRISLEFMPRYPDPNASPVLDSWAMKERFLAEWGFVYVKGTQTPEKPGDTMVEEER